MQLTYRLTSITLFFASFLLFSLEPMIGKLLLPSLGGTPLVWNTCLVFFQCALLLGYLTSNYLIKRFSIHIHLMVLLFLLVFPFLFSSEFSTFNPQISAENGISNPTIWLFSWLTLTIAIPFIALSIVPSLFQYWYGRVNEKFASSTYKLYASSNAGSLLGLLFYPLLIEKYFTMSDQIFLWKLFLIVATLLISLTFSLLIFYQPKTKINEEIQLGESNYNWISCFALSFLPSALLSSVTLFLVMDVISAPLLWIIPLALYLISFIIAFAWPSKINLTLVGRASAFLSIVLITFILLRANHPAILILPLHLMLFFLISLYSHTILSLSRPTLSSLPSYYLTISFGGAVGGVSVLLIAPQLFSTPIEYPILLICAISLRIFYSKEKLSPSLMDLKHMVICGFLVASGYYLVEYLSAVLPTSISNLLSLGVAAIFCYSKVHIPVRFTFGLISIFIVGTYYFSNNENVLLKERNFFGTVKVIQEDGSNCHTMLHGSTIHGGQCNISTTECIPLHYFHNSGPIGKVFDITKKSYPQLDIGIIGLGVGSLTCYARKEDNYTYYEIDALIEDVAKNQNLFTFLKNTAAKSVDIKLGDARLSLEKNPDEKLFDLLIIDAFSSDVIPSHLLTIEAIKLYKKKLKDNGFLVFHVSNRFFDLSPVLGTVADKLNLDAILLSDIKMTEVDTKNKKFSSEWIILIEKNNNLLSELAMISNSSSLNARHNILWTDDYSSLIPLIKKNL